jgi:hypothetical protein
MTDLAFEALCRLWLNDKDKDFWDSDDFTVLKATSLQSVADKWWMLLEPLQAKAVTFDVQANVQDYDPRVIATDCKKILRIEVAETGDKIHYVWRNQLFFYEKMNPAPPTNWTMLGGLIRTYPKTAVLMPAYLRMHYLPDISLLSDLPTCLHPVVAMELVVAARLKDEKVTNDIMMALQRYEDSARRFLQQFQAQEPYVAALFDSAEDVDDY